MDPELIPLFELFAAIIAAAVAFIQNRKKKAAERETAEAQDRTAEAEDRAGEIVSFFDPGDQSVTSPPDDIPARSWTMSDPTKRWLTFDHSPEEQQSLLQQVAEAESKGLPIYTLDLPSAWYEIEYGLIRSSGRKIPG
jgi:hypothetical protein